MDAKAEHQGSLPDPGAEFWKNFERVQQDLLQLHADWSLFVQLYGRSAQRIEMLNKSARSFFARLQDIMLRDACMGICRLLDPAKSAGNTNLVLESICSALDPLDHKTVRIEAEKYLKEARDVAKPFKDLRNKRVGHRDEVVALDDLPPKFPSRATTNSVLRAMADLMNAIETAFKKSSCVYEHISFDGGDANSLAMLLKQALHYKQLMRDGTIDRALVTKLPFRDA